jgi:Outer membrane protein beta-barrel domain
MQYLLWKKKIALLPLALLAASLTCSAQKLLNMENHDDKPYYFGITLSYNQSRFQVSHHPRFLQYDSVMVADPINRGGFSLGLAATAKLTNRFQLRFNPQLIFAEKTIIYNLKYPTVFETPVMTKKVESILLHFPIQIKFNSDRIGNFRVYMLGGVKYDYDLASNARNKRAESLVKINKNDFGVEVGVGFNFFFESFIFSPELKISNGLRDVHARDEALKIN